MQIDRQDLALLSAIQREGSLAAAAHALDLAAPIAHAGGDDIQNFSFFVGYSR